MLSCCAIFNPRSSILAFDVSPRSGSEIYVYENFLKNFEQKPLHFQRFPGWSPHSHDLNDSNVSFWVIYEN